jgi:hypothetical protein
VEVACNKTGTLAPQSWFSVHTSKQFAPEHVCGWMEKACSNDQDSSRLSFQITLAILQLEFEKNLKLVAGVRNNASPTFHLSPPEISADAANDDKASLSCVGALHHAAAVLLHKGVATPAAQ